MTVAHIFACAQSIISERMPMIEPWSFFFRQMFNERIFATAFKLPKHRQEPRLKNLIFFYRRNLVTSDDMCQSHAASNDEFLLANFVTFSWGFSFLAAVCYNSRVTGLVLCCVVVIMLNRLLFLAFRPSPELIYTLFFTSSKFRCEICLFERRVRAWGISWKRCPFSHRNAP